MSFRLWARALALAVVLSALVASSAAASFPTYNGKIAYTAYNPFAGATAVYTMGASGSGQTALSNARGTSGDSAPAWSADGQQVAFARGGAIWVVGADGVSARPVTDGTGDSDPTWSPNSARIAFVRDGDVWTVGTAGGPATNLTAEGPVTDPDGSPETDSAPDWSPDGTKIAFETNREGSPQIYTMNATDGGSPAAVIGGMQPSWSPDGQRIAFGTGGSIAVVDADGTNPVTIRAAYDRLSSPAWSPDGTEIAYAGGYGIFVMDASGDRPRQLTFDPGRDPSWQPNDHFVPTAPEAPRSVRTTGLDSTTGEVSWSPPASDSGSPITNYTVHLRGLHDFTVSGSETSATLTGLTPGRGYELSVTARNAGGDSPGASTQLNMPFAGTAPLRVTAAAGDGKVALTWREFGRSPDGWEILNDKRQIVKTVADRPEGTVVVDGVPNGAPVRFTVRAVGDSAHESEPSNAVTPRAGAPDPLVVQSSPDEGGTVSTGPDDGPTVLIPLTSSATLADELAGTIVLAQGTPSTPPVAGYSFLGQQVDVAIHRNWDVYEDPFHRPLKVALKVDPSLIPAGGVASVAVLGDGEPVPDCVGDASDTSDPDRVCVAERIEPSDAVPYGTIRLLGEHVYGSFNLATPGAQQAPLSAPQAVTAAGGDGQASVSWLAPAENGGSAIDHYDVLNADGSVATSVPGDATSATVSGLTNGQSVAFRVRAVNGDGATATSDPPTTVTPRAGVTATAGSADAGGTVASGGALPSSVTLAGGSAGTVTIAQSATTATAPSTGYEFLGQQVQIDVTNPDGSRYTTTAADPLTLSFDVDPSLVQAAGSLAAVTFYRDGILVPDCGPGGLAALPGPDPVCVASRTAPGTIRILTTHASLWNLAVKVTPASLCGLTKQLVQAAARAKGDNLAAAACKHLDGIIAGTKPAQRAAAVKAYGNAVDALANPGQRALTAAQASRLKALASAL